ncbi:MAG: hypothetical protein JHC95_24050, partial [Solirubrobacteraceae bacterium]|nr:hypothetical protein [Solirubrobacteraceae bacterium]
DVPTARPAAPAPAKPGAPAKPAAAITITAAKLKAALKNGLVVKVAVPGAGRLSGKATTSGRVMAKGAVKVKRAGSTSVRLRFTKGAKKMLGREREVTLKIATTFTPKRGKATKRQSAKVTLKR